MFLVNLNVIKEDQVMHNAVQNVGDTGPPYTLMGIHDIMKNIE
jgi:hypothetical protein